MSGWRGVGFHDVDYHSGEPFDNTDWSAGVLADRPPGAAALTLGLFRPEPGEPDSVTATLVAPSAGAGIAAGAVPDGAAVPGPLLGLTKNGTNLDLVWGASCSVGDTDYAVYEGLYGDFTTHTRKTCSTGGATFTTISPQSDDSYYLVVPLSADREGSYGLNSDGIDRPQGSPACLVQESTACP